ncbi:MAG: methyltransferase domain-containing protein [Candidatus Kariarchaeaceae archaeon]|jgi:SAM-dependent methyltransferase
MTRNSVKLDEIKVLHDNGFLFSGESEESIKEDTCETWPEVFWRRKERHSKRLDPEIAVISNYNAEKILEIGCAYGRVLRKILESNDGSEVMGIERCPNFQQFHQKYSLDYPILDTAKIIFDDFFSTTKVKNNYFDLIVLPMNTFPIDKSRLFSRVKQYLKTEGRFIFSTNKFPYDFDLDTLDKSKDHSYDGELLVELGNHSIAVEYFNFGWEVTQQGVKQVYYTAYHKFSLEKQLISRELERSEKEIFDPKKLQEMIVNQGFTIELRDEQSHSDIYVLSMK